MMYSMKEAKQLLGFKPSTISPTIVVYPTLEIRRKVIPMRKIGAVGWLFEIEDKPMYNDEEEDDEDKHR